MTAYLNARVSLYRERLWSEPQFDAFLATPDEEVSSFLGRRGLPGLAAGFQGQDPLSLEARIVTQLLDETRVLLRPLTGPARQFILYWTERFEVSNVKTLIRAKMAGERPAAIAQRLMEMGPLGRLELDALLHAEDVFELFRRLEASPYADIVRHARRAFEESHDPFVLDATLDRVYYEGLAHRAQPLENEAGQAFRHLMADLVDRINLVWLLRYRFNYGLPPAQVYYLLVASRYRLQGETLQRLVALPTPDAVLAQLPPALAQSLSGAESIPQVSARLEQTAAERAGAILGSGAHPLARAFAYLILRERDLRGVRAILRGRHLGLADDTIRQALGHARAEAA